MDIDTSIGKDAAARFPTTHWTQIFDAARPGDEGGHRALETFCGTYWRPLYVYCRARFGMTNDAAKDCVQEFFAHALKSSWLGGVRRTDGRFRNFLRVTFENFARNFRRTERRARNRGGRLHVALDVVIEEPSDRTVWNPTNVWNQAWLRTLLTRALGVLQEEMGRKGMQAAGALFQRYYLDRASAADYKTLAAESGLTAGQVAQHLFVARRWFREILLRLVSETTETMDEAHEELRELFGADV